MNFKARICNHQNASALVVTLFMVTAILLGLGSYLLLVRAQYVSVARSQAWNASMTVAEAGVEEALAQLNPGALETTVNVDRTANGWGNPVGNFYGPISRTVSTNNSYTITFTTDRWPTIYSTGYTKIPELSATLVRVVRVETTNVALFNVSLAGKTNIDMNGNGLSTDSFNSSSTNLSTLGRYDSSKTSTNGDVAVLYGTLDLGNHVVHGDAYLGPTASLVGSLSQISGNVSTDYNYDYPSVSPPDTSGWFTLSTTMSGTAPDGNSYDYIFTNSVDYIVPNVNGKIYVGTNAHVRLLAQAGTTSKVLVAGGGSTNSNHGTLTVYIAASSFTIGGSGAVDGGRAACLSYFGLASNKTITYSGNAIFVGTVYAPDADLTLTGGGSSTFDICGSIIAKTVTFNGHFMFHYDEDLLTSSASRGYFARSWAEL
jgi:hypothetical protein